MDQPKQIDFGSPDTPRCRHPDNDAEAGYEVIFPKRGVEGLGHGAESRVTFQV